MTSLQRENLHVPDQAPALTASTHPLIGAGLSLRQAARSPSLWPFVAVAAIWGVLSLGPTFTPLPHMLFGKLASWLTYERFGLWATVLLLVPALWLQAADLNETKRIAEATVVLEEIMGAADKAVPRSIMEKAEAIAVFPSLLKGGLVIGAQHGRGIISVRDKKTGGWSVPAFLTINGGSVGAQIGAQAIEIGRAHV